MFGSGSRGPELTISIARCAPCRMDSSRSQHCHQPAVLPECGFFFSHNTAAQCSVLGSRSSGARDPGPLSIESVDAYPAVKLKKVCPVFSLHCRTCDGTRPIGSGFVPVFGGGQHGTAGPRNRGTDEGTRFQMHRAEVDSK